MEVEDCDLLAEEVEREMTLSVAQVEAV